MKNNNNVINDGEIIISQLPFHAAKAKAANAANRKEQPCYKEEQQRHPYRHHPHLLEVPSLRLQEITAND